MQKFHIRTMPQLVLVLLLVLSLALLSAGCQDFWVSNQGRSTTSGQTANPTTKVTSTASSTSAQSSSQATTTATSKPNESTTTAKSTAATTKATTAAPTTTGESGQKLGFVVATVAASAGGSPGIKIDYVEMFTGAQALAKAHEDGADVIEIDENGHEYIPNDYYIRNNNAQLRTLPLAASCVIKLVDNSIDATGMRTVSFNEFSQETLEYHRLMYVTLANGIVQSMSEQYLP
jgi:hypothetical protein